MSKRPRSLKELVIADLERAQSLIRKVKDEIDPQFRIATPEGDYWIAMTLSADPAERVRELRKVSLFMAWKLSPGFTLASELIEPDAVHCFGATHKEQLAAISLIERNPLRFAKLQWLSPEQIGDEIRELLPKGAITLDAGMIDELKEYFGPQGKFPAVHIETGRVGG
ncbi:MAG: hypothetical protein ACLQF2_01765 [Rhodomicrobium sp.]